ncbi:MAG: tetratricopeptide repeat protein [Aulosira sp. DedQUE10]|nr:tetratricopeptide repeat protein [Aulosira sp. DedQUE10]
MQGDIYHNNNDKARALEFYQQSLAIFKAVNNPNKQLGVLTQIMRSHYSLIVSANNKQKDYSRAIDEAGGDLRRSRKL